MRTPWIVSAAATALGIACHRDAPRTVRPDVPVDAGDAPKAGAADAHSESAADTGPPPDGVPDAPAAHRTVRDVGATITEARPKLKGCNQLVPGGTEGKVAFSFDMSPSGKATNIVVTLGTPEVDKVVVACALKVVEGLDFGPAEQSIKLYLPVVYRKSSP